MKPPTQRRTAIVALLLAPALTACGFNAQTDQVYQPALGIIDRSGDVYVLNALIVSGEDGSGTFAATLVNTQTADDRLETVAGPDITASRRTVEIPGRGNALLGETGDVTVEGASIKPGSFVELELAFQSGQTTTVKVPVVHATGDYADVPLPDAGSSSDSE